MIKLTLGILLWGLTHLIPAAFSGLRKSLLGKLGENGYKGAFTLLMVLAIYLVISGWKAAVPESVFLPPVWGRHVTALLVLIGFVLFFAPYPPNNIKRTQQHQAYAAPSATDRRGLLGRRPPVGQRRGTLHRPVRWPGTLGHT